ncbi:hypothetical protein M6D93_13875 [Jatrophihabitans telluris]|uniref:Ferric oxidoreductase domain-containing protein n=1 Tax=Jatrophihabitans telluris TaxID=2038343 RepID=A0ABY4QVC9_9ACTN|nr:hypothetical protein [Jatrophihabitans telluris]UQX87383.1 hypothetical protein M6D93_13875 [Jatrophihabitans telluris]
MAVTQAGAAPRRIVRRLGLILAVALSAAITLAIVGWVAQSVAGDRMAPWIIGRASGVTAYLLLVTLVLMGLVLSHPWRSRIQRPSNANRIRLHVALAVFTLAFIALHIVVLGMDRYAGVGWRGALLPMGASYRPVATTLGLVGLWCGLLAGVTAALATRVPRWLWWPLHKVSSISLILVWLHGVFGGGDTAALTAMYLVTAGLVLIVAVGRYAAKTPADRVAELAR